MWRGEDEVVRPKTGTVQAGAFKNRCPWEPESLTRP